ncbi:MAG: hypothetical protein LWX83_10670 [Anaerolineae bacterium]|nr:hypothetical protein [Anaerolineae bacterium]
MGGRKFYDIHCHAFNLSHPAFLPFIKRLGVDRYLFLNSIPGINFFMSRFAGDKMNDIERLLAVVENDIGDFFLMLENVDVLPLLSDGKLLIGSYDYEKMVLTPLMMDFGMRQVNRMPDIHTKIPSHKRITEQVIDLFNGIKSYHEQSDLHFLKFIPFWDLIRRIMICRKTVKTRFACLNCLINTFATLMPLPYMRDHNY